MKKRIRYKDERLGKLKIVEDFLPRPHELVFKEHDVEVRLRVRRSSMNFYKKLAKANKSRHDRVMRRLLDQYAALHSGRM
jgi:hypothetical protein